MLTKKIKYQGGITKKITSLLGVKNKNKFRDLLTSSGLDDLLTTIMQVNSLKIKIELVSFSSFQDFPEQILSILSFLRYAGEPVKWTIYSDGTHSKEQIELVEMKFKFVQLVLIRLSDVTELPDLYDVRLTEFTKELLHYSKTKHLGKKVFFYLNHPITIPTIFLDSDILFYSGFKKGIKLISTEEANGWFLPDTNWGCLDSRYLATHEEQVYQVNGGFYIANKSIDNIEQALSFLRSLDFTYEYFTDQTIMHIYCKENKFSPLDSRMFIINTDDQFDFSYRFKPNEIAIRHYTGPVRHKMWQKSFRWHLGI